MTKRDLYNELHREAIEADSKAGHYRTLAKNASADAEYWQEQAKCARGLLCRIDAEAHTEEKQNV